MWTQTGWVAAFLMVAVLGADTIAQQDRNSGDRCLTKQASKPNSKPCSSSAPAQLPSGTQAIEISGMIIDAKNQPVAGAEVRAYVFDYFGAMGGKYSQTLADRKTTGAGGAFLLKVRPAGVKRGLIFVIARKKGLAMNWQSALPGHAITLVLTAPTKLSGVVVDESGRPVAKAEVGTVVGIGPNHERSIPGQPDLDWLVRRTDSLGHFEFDCIPADARAGFMVTAPGKGRLTTVKQTPRMELQFVPGQSNTRIVLSPEAKIEGLAVEAATGKPVPEISLTARRTNQSDMFCLTSSSCQLDGRFGFVGLREGRYEITVTRSGMDPSQWVCAPVNVSLDTGGRAKDVKVQLVRGGLIEVAVKDPNDNPLAKVSLTARMAKGKSYFSDFAETNTDGIAILRLLEGEYVINVYKHLYVRALLGPIRVSDGQTANEHVHLTPLPTVRGIVRDPTSKPAVGATVIVLPASRQEQVLEEDGRFEIIVDYPDTYHPGLRANLVVARDARRNLTTTGEVEIGEHTAPLHLTLAPGGTLRGRVTDMDGKPLAGAAVSMYLSANGYGSSIQNGPVLTDGSGLFEVGAMPVGYRYSIQVTAGGFGESWEDAEIAEGQPCVSELETLVLPRANLTISGVVVNTDGKTMPGAWVNVGSHASGHQPHRDVTADKDGKFTVEGIVDEDIWVMAYLSETNRQICGSVIAKGGDQDVKVVLRSQGHVTSAPHPATQQR